MSWKKPHEAPMPFNEDIIVRTIEGRQRAVQLIEVGPKARWYKPFGTVSYTIEKPGPKQLFTVTEPWEAIHPNDVVTWKSR